MDFAGYGAEAEELFKQQALNTRAAIARALKGPTGISATWCEGEACGVRIPEARRLAVPGVRLCVDCATRDEQRTMKNGKAGL